MTHYQHGKSWTERATTEGYPDAQEYKPSYDLERHSKAQGHSHTSLGITGHLVHMGAMLFPVLAAELITDLEKYKKVVRMGSVATTVLYEGLYTMREAQRRQRQEEKLAECRSEYGKLHEP